MRIKRHKNRNTYLLSESGVWVRDFNQENVPFLDINSLTLKSDHAKLLENEVRNRILRLPQIDTENFFFPKVLIVSDGYGFKEKHRLLSDMPHDVTIIAVNGALAKWELVGPACPSDKKRTIDFYVVNNPYEECMKFVPKRTRYYPQCLASVWTNADFTSLYDSKGTVYQYTPTPPQDFTTLKSAPIYSIDDYRNPVCAAISFAYRCGADKIAFLCCDDSFNGDRPAAERLDNGLFTYPHHLKTQAVIDSMLYWFKKAEDREVAVVDSSSGRKYSNATYIKETKLVDFFEGHDG